MAIIQSADAERAPPALAVHRIDSQLHVLLAQTMAGYSSTQVRSPIWDLFFTSEEIDPSALVNARM